jgi:hypothetical protein
MAQTTNFDTVLIGSNPSLNLYNLVAPAGNTAVRYELYNQDGKLIATGSMTAGSTARSFGYLILAAGVSQTLWGAACSAKLSVTGANTVYVNTGGGDESGSGAALSITPDANSLVYLLPGGYIYNLGAIS